MTATIDDAAREEVGAVGRAGGGAELVRLAKEKGLWLTGPGGLHSTGRRVDEALSTIEGIDPPPV